MESSAERRLKAIQSHLVPATDDVSRSLIRSNPTAGEFLLGQGFSVVLPEKLQTGKWNVYRSARSPLKLVTRFPDHPEIGTLHDNFEHAIQTFQDYKYLGSRIRVDGTVGDYKWMTYGEAGTARTAIGSGLHYYGLQPGARVGLYFINRPEWMIVDHACSAYSYTSIPLYDTLGPDAVKYIVNHADVQAIFCVPTTLNTLLTFLSEIPSVRLIVVVGGIDEHLPSLPSTTGMKLLSYTRLLSQVVYQKGENPTEGHSLHTPLYHLYKKELFCAHQKKLKGSELLLNGKRLDYILLQELSYFSLSHINASGTKFQALCLLLLLPLFQLNNRSLTVVDITQGVRTT